MTEPNAGREISGDSVDECLLTLECVDTRRWDEVDAVRIDLDRRGTVLVQTGHDLLDDALARQRHLLGSVIVVEQSAAVSQVAIERVDEDLERALHPLPHRPLGLLTGLRRATGLPLGVQPPA